MLDIDSSLRACLALLALWALIGVAGLMRPMSLGFVGRMLFPLGALCGVALAVVAATSFGAPAEQAVLKVGLPDLPMHVRRDALASFFLVLLGATSAGISVFAAGYFRRGAGTAPGLMCLQYHLFLASMGFVLLADDAYAFMVTWETMALSSYFLVTTQHGLPEIRRAGFLYLLIAHVGALAILLSFGVMQGGSWQFTFDAMRGAHLTPYWAAVAFLLALFGFGAKAGLVPLHVWLPEAHPAAPSPVSALMSGAMLKMAVYGVLRVSFDLLGKPEWWWGLVLLALGLFSALYGVIFAAVQTDMKRLLAWSSIENLGIIFAAIGLGIVFHGVGMNSLAALALIAALYHSLNHAFMKSLLFLGTGAVLHSTGERNLGRLGGLIHRMPWVAWLTLVGALAMAGLPPLNGFVSEWLLLQAFLFAHQVPRTFVNMILPIGAALVALSAALAAYVMVKFFGVIFLGQPREPALARAHDAGLLERIGLVWLALGCLLLGLLPTYIIDGTAHRGRAIQRRGAAEHGRAVVATGAAGRPASLLFRTRPSRRARERRRVDSACGAALLSPPRAPRRCLGWRLWTLERAHARHRRRLRPADPPHLRGLLRHEARIAVGLRLCAPLQRRGGRSNLAMVICAAWHTRATHCRYFRLAAARAYLHLPAV